MELCEHEEVNILKENHLEYRKLISNAQKNLEHCLTLPIVMFKQMYFLYTFYAHKKKKIGSSLEALCVAKSGGCGSSVWQSSIKGKKQQGALW